ncbi:MAG: hypothetical protein ABMA13_23795, partial [Chthoniobacteraceae bacterium]
GVGRIDAMTPATLTVAGQTLSGNFAFERGISIDGSVLVRIVVTEGSLNLGTEVSVTNARGYFVLKNSAAAGTLSADVVVNVPNVNFTGTFTVSLNNTSAAVDESIVLAGETVRLTLPAGPYLRVEGLNVALSVAGQVIKADFAFEQVTRGPPMSVVKIVRVAAKNVSIVLGDGTTNFLSVTQGEGLFLVLPSGIAGRISGVASVNLPGVSLSATLTAEINQTGALVNEDFTIGGQTLNLSLDAGTFVRVTGEDVAINIAGQVLTGDFTFDKATVMGQQVVTVTVANVHLGFGDGTREFVSVDILSGSLTLKPAGVVANFPSVMVTTNIPGVTFMGTFGIAIDTTNPANRYLRVSGNDVKLGFSGLELQGDFSFEQITNGAGEKVVRVALSDVKLVIGPSANPFVRITNGQGSLLIDRNGVAADFSVTASFPGLAAAGLALSFNTVRVQLNTGAAAVKTTFAVGGQTIALDVPAGPFLRVTVLGATLNIGGASGFNLTGDFLFDQTGTGAAQVTRIAMANVSVTISGQGIKNGEGAFVLKAGGVAGILTGEASVAAGPVSVGGSFGVRINSTTAAVNETIAIGTKTINVRFSDTEVAGAGGSFFQFFGGDLSLNIGNFVTIEGNVSFTTVGGKTIFAGNGLRIFLGQGPSKLSNGEPNPLATGVLVSDATIGLIKFQAGTYALAATGKVEIVGINGITISGNVLVRFNNSGLVVDELLTIPNTEQDIVVKFDTTGLVTQFEATQVEISVLGQTLKGDFAFNKQTVGGEQVISVAAQNVSLGLGDGTTDFVSVTGARGAVLLTPAGVAAQLSNANVTLNVPGVQFSGTFGIAINTTTVAVDRQFTIGTDTIALKLPAGPFLSVKADNVMLTVAGQTLAGNFALEQLTQSGGAKITRVAVSKVSIQLGDGGTPFVSVTNGRGSFLVTAAGLAGRIDADVALNVPGVTFSGSFGVAVNTTTAAVMDTFEVGGETIMLDLPAGPYLRIDANKAQLNVAGQSLSGNFAFERVTRVGAGPAVRIAASDVSLKLGDGATDLVTLSNGQGNLLVTAAGIAGRFSADIATNIPGVSISGSLALEINNTTAAVNETLMVGGQSVGLVLPAGPYVRIAGTNVSVDILGQKISGDFAIEKATNTRGESKLRVAITNARLAFSDGTNDLVVIGGASAYFVVTPLGMAGSFAGTVTFNIPNVSFTGSFMAEVNNTTMGIDESFMVGGQTVALRLPAGPFLKVSGTNVALSVAGQTLTGNFAFSQSTTLAGAKIVRVAISGVSLKLGDGTTDFVSLTNGTGAFIVTPQGLAGSLSVNAAFNIPGVQISGDVSIQVNNTMAPVNEMFLVGGQTITIDLPAGPFLR